MEAAQVLRKSEFAAMCGVTPARVTQWIAEGKIKPDSLIGIGRMACIDVARATADLKSALDPSQRFGLNGLTTNLDAPPPAATAPIRALDDTVEAKIKAEKLRHAQLTTARLEEEDRLQRGLYTRTADARAEMTRAVGDLMKAFEGALPDLASALAAKFQLAQRDALHLLRAEFRNIRARLAAQHEAAAQGAPETVEDDLDLPESVQ